MMIEFFLWLGVIAGLIGVLYFIARLIIGSVIGPREAPQTEVAPEGERDLTEVPPRSWVKMPSAMDMVEYVKLVFLIGCVAIIILVIWGLGSGAFSVGKTVVEKLKLPNQVTGKVSTSYEAIHTKVSPLSRGELKDWVVDNLSDHQDNWLPLERKIDYTLSVSLDPDEVIYAPLPISAAFMHKGTGPVRERSIWDTLGGNYPAIGYLDFKKSGGYWEREGQTFRFWIVDRFDGKRLDDSSIRLRSDTLFAAIQSVSSFHDDFSLSFSLKIDEPEGLGFVIGSYREFKELPTNEKGKKKGNESIFGRLPLTLPVLNRKGNSLEDVPVKWKVKITFSPLHPSDDRRLETKNSRELYHEVRLLDPYDGSHETVLYKVKVREDYLELDSEKLRPAIDIDVVDLEIRILQPNVLVQVVVLFP